MEGEPVLKKASITHEGQQAVQGRADGQEGVWQPWAAALKRKRRLEPSKGQSGDTNQPFLPNFGN